MSEIIRPGSIEGRLKMRGDCLYDMGEQMHQAFGHSDRFEICKNPNCVMVKRILDLTDTEEKFRR